MGRSPRLLLLWLGSTMPAGAQTGAASVNGLVRDATAAVVPGADVQLTEKATGRAFHTKSNAVGRYTLPSLPIGAYRLEVQAPGMKTWQADLVLTVNETATVETVLAVADAATQITVAGEVTNIVTDSNPTIGTTLERSRIDQLPLNGRDYRTLVAASAPGMDFAGSSSPRAWGMRDSALEFVQDGASLTNRDQGQVTYMPPSMETIAEFKMETTNSSAKLNRPATGIITTRSGTNALHGSLFEVLRNNYVAMARARQDIWSTRPKFIRNQFGYNAGGPVVLPKLYDGRNKTFFFVVTEWQRERGGNTVGVKVPTMKFRQGDFSGLTDGQGRAITLYDPWSTDAKWSRVPFVNNVIPAQRQSPLAKYLYGITPTPNVDVNPLASANYFGPGYTRSNKAQFSARIDHRFTDNDQTFFRVQRNGFMNAQPGTDANVYPTLGGETNVRNFMVNSYVGLASWVHTFSPRLFSETLVNYSFDRFDIYTGQYSRDWSKELGLPNPFNALGFPEIRDVGVAYQWLNAERKRDNRTGILNIDENLTYVAGRHSLDFGGRFRKDRVHVLFDQAPGSGLSFASAATALYDPATGANMGAKQQTGFDGANLFLGAAAAYNATFNTQMLYMLDLEYAGYIQDNWKVTDRFTLNLGLRYEHHPPTTLNDNVMPGFDFDKRAVVYGPSLDGLIKLGRTTQDIANLYTQYGVKFLSAQEAGWPEHVFENTGLGLQPRAGFAWRTAGGRRPVVVRGGYGLYTYLVSARSWNARTAGIPPNQANYSLSFVNPAQSPDGQRNYSLRSAPTIIAGLNSANAIDITKPSSVSRGSYAIWAFNREQPLLRIHQANFTLEREVLENTVARAAFIGVFGRDLEQFQSYNRAPLTDYIYFSQAREPRPTGEYANVALRSWDKVTYGNIDMYQKNGFSNLTAVQLELQRRYSKGYGYHVFYVMENAFKAGGQSWGADIIPDPASYLPGTVPTDIDALNRFYNYKRDTTIPKHKLSYNFLADLPVGRGKLLARNAPGWVNKIIGGWQVAGIGSTRSRYWTLSTNYWGGFGDVETYGKQYPIGDCRSGKCYPGYLWANVYIPPSQINSVNAQGQPNGIMGVPSNYKAAAAYVDNVALNNFVNITLKNGTPQRVSLDNGLHPWRNQFLSGSWLHNLDASLYKVVSINERFRVRFNADFFNVLNSPGQPLPDGNGIAMRNVNAQSARQTQLTLRVEW